MKWCVPPIYRIARDIGKLLSVFSLCDYCVYKAIIIEAQFVFFSLNLDKRIKDCRLKVGLKGTGWEHWIVEMSMSDFALNLNTFK